MKDARPPRGSHPPGTFWYYNNWDFNVLGTIFIQLTGEDIFQAIFVIPDLEVVITHKVDYDTWTGDWNTVFELVRQVIHAKVY